MNTDAEYLNKRFNSHFLSKGGLFDYSLDELVYKADFGFYIKYAKELIVNIADANTNPGNVPVILTGYINNPKINACADRDDYFYYIGINSGLVFVLERLFNSLLADPTYFPLIGNSNEECYEFKGVDFTYKNVYSLIDDGLSLEYRKPASALRATVAKFLTYAAVNFLVTHELTHILNGHIDYNKSLGNFQMLEEQQTIENGKEDFLLRQTLEFDADSVAICDLFTNALFLNKNDNNLPPEFEFILKDTSNVVGLTFFASYTLLRLFGNDFTPDEVLKKKYPAFEVRRKIIPLTVSTIVAVREQQDRLDSALGNSILDKLLEYSVYAEAAFSGRTVADAKVDKNVYKSLLPSDDVLNQLNMIKSKWATIRPELEKHAYSKLPASDNDDLVRSDK